MICYKVDTGIFLFQRCALVVVIFLQYKKIWVFVLKTYEVSQKKPNELF